MKYLIAFAPAILWLIVVTYLSTGGGVPMPSFNLIGPDKLAHAGAYALLAWLCLYGWRKSGGQASSGAAMGWILLSTAGYGALMEWVQQTFYPNRYFEFDDMLANTLGVAAAIACWYWRYRKRPDTHQKHKH